MNAFTSTHHIADRSFSTTCAGWQQQWSTNRQSGNVSSFMLWSLCHVTHAIGVARTSPRYTKLGNMSPNWHFNLRVKPADFCGFEIHLNLSFATSSTSSRLQNHRLAPVPRTRARHRRTNSVHDDADDTTSHVHHCKDYCMQAYLPHACCRQLRQPRARAA